MNEKEFKKVKYEIEPIGWVETDEDGKLVLIMPEFQPAMLELEDYSHLQIIWWAHFSDGSENRKTLTTGRLFKKGPDRLGVFSTRSPARPNPVMSSTIAVSKINRENGIIRMPFMDAEAGSPVLDIKPYQLMERVKNCRMPSWCAHWPQYYEDAAAFDWENEINMPNLKKMQVK